MASKKRPATPKQGATDQRGNLVKIIERKVKELLKEVGVKDQIPGWAAALRVRDLDNQLATLGWCLDVVRKSDDRARKTKGGW